MQVGNIQAERQSQVSIQVDILLGNIERLKNEIGRLEDRLQSVMMPEACQPEELKPPSNLVPLATKLMEIADLIVRYAERISSLRERVEI